MRSESVILIPVRRCLIRRVKLVQQTAFLAGTELMIWGPLAFRLIDRVIEVNGDSDGV